MIRHAARRGAAKLSIAAVVATAAASVTPAQAVISTPVPLGNSVAKGFNNSPFIVAMSYNKVINGLASNVTVVDVNGDPVEGSSLVHFTDEKTLVFQTSEAGRFNEDLSPYTATFTARARNQALATPSSVEALTFEVDFIVPFPPNVHLNEGGATVATDVIVSAPGDDLTINGTAEDIVSDTGIVSGVAQVDVHFYNPAMNPTEIARVNLGSPPSTLPSVTADGTPEIAALHQTIEYPCDPACNVAESLSIDISDLPLGYWNVKVSVTDAAGNQSAQSEALKVLKLTAPS